MENMKIGIDCHNLEGQRTGVGRYLWNLLQEFNRTGSDPVRLEFFLYFKSEIPQDIQKLVKDGESFEYSHDRENIQIGKWNLRILNSNSNAIFKHWLLPKMARQDNVDILFCPDYVLPIYVGRLTSHIRTAVAIHDIIYEARPSEYSWPSWKDKILLKWASKKSAKKADIIFAPSEFTKSEIIKYYKVNPKKIIVTPLAPDPIFQNLTSSGSDAPTGAGANLVPPGRVPIKLAEIKQKYSIQDRYIFFIGSIFNRRFLPQKIKGFAEFAKGYSDFQFLIIGKNYTQPFQDIGALICEVNKELGKVPGDTPRGRETIVWKEHVSDEELVWLYNGAFATLWCSSYEGFGLPVLESMACGTPVITSPMGSLPEIAGDAAMYVARPENPQEIEAALIRLARDDSYYSELVTKGLAHAARFSWQKCAQQTLDKILKLQ